MPKALYGSVGETSTSTGTGAMTLAGALVRHTRFNARYAVNDTMDYTIIAVDAQGVPTGEWESGIGTYSSSNTLTRTTVKESSNSDAAVSFAAGTKHVYVAPLAERLNAIYGIAQNSRSANYTLTLDDANKHILHPSADTTARTFTIPSNASVPFEIGTAVTFVNQNSAGVVTIAITSDTMRLAGAGTTGSRTLAANGIATALKVTSTEWIISGTGLT